jgi:hypothetical protein
LFKDINFGLNTKINFFLFLKIFLRKNPRIIKAFAFLFCLVVGDHQTRIIPQVFVLLLSFDRVIQFLVNSLRWDTMRSRADFTGSQSKMIRKKLRKSGKIHNIQKHFKDTKKPKTSFEV